MNKIVLSGFTFVLGVGIGCASTYYLMRKSFEQRLDEEIDNLRSVDKKLPKVHNDGEAVNPTDEDGNPLTTVISSISDGPVNVDKVAYHKLAENYYKEVPAEDDDKDVNDILAEAEHPEDSDEDDIHLISLDDYETDDEKYDKENIVWYTGDDILTDSSGDVIDNSFTIVGEVLESIDPSDGELIYVRNDVLDVDYEIEIVHAAYKDMV